MKNTARHAGESGRLQRGALVEPVRVVLARPGRGWIAGLLGAGIKAAAVLVAVAVAVAVLAGVTVLAWWAGLAQIPVLVLVYGTVAVAACGFFIGRSGRRLAWWPRLPPGPGQLAWQPGARRVQTGLIWVRDDEPSIGGPDGTAATADQEGRP